ncbi:hypothetical protein ACFX13_019583 [Malus domestica]
MRSAELRQCTAFSMVDDIFYRGLQEREVVDVLKNIGIDVLQSIRMTFGGWESFLVRPNYWRKRCMQVVIYVVASSACVESIGGSSAACTVSCLWVLILIE